jgi:hypothetical protein
MAHEKNQNPKGVAHEKNQNPKGVAHEVHRAFFIILGLPISLSCAQLKAFFLVCQLFFSC